LSPGDKGGADKGGGDDPLAGLDDL
jgi:hypothetical protein